MIKEKVNTGGLKEFYYDKEDYKRIESEDTDSTKEFKEELRFWREHPYKYLWKNNKNKIYWLSLIILIIMLTIFLLK